MCGLIGGDVDPVWVEAALPAIAHRGPDATGLITTGPWTLGHVRLAIQDVSDASTQPYQVGGTTVTYNGELWWPEDVRIAFPRAEWRTTGDTEVVAVALDQLGEHALPAFRGMFGLAWVDQDGDLHLARDAFGEIPLHYGWTYDDRFVYASEVAPLITLGVVPSTVRWVEPGTVVTVTAAGKLTTSTWLRPVGLTPSAPSQPAPYLRALLTEGAVGRMTADVPVAVLASGGLDSSAVLALLVAAGYKPQTYVAVHDPRATDLRHARAVTSHLGLQLTEVPVPSPTTEDLTRVVEQIEMPHKAQVEIAWACLHLAEAVAADGHKVVLSGEGSDELWASYGMDYHGIQQHGWHEHRWRSFRGQHRKNFPRTNKVFMRHGVEARLPFLHEPLVRYALRLPEAAVREGTQRHVKAVLADAVGDLLPAESVWRAKAAFQTNARLDKAAAAAVTDPRGFYTTTHRRIFGGAPA